MFLYLLTLFIIITLFWWIAFELRKKKYPTLTLKQFLLGESTNGSNKKLYSIKTMLIGLIFGIIFGFIDNYYLYSGMKTFEKYLPRNPELKAGWANTYSDIIGVALGTSISYIAIDYFDVDR